MGTILFFDTETTGLPDSLDAPVLMVDNWPRIVQLSWIVATIDREIISEQNFIVRPSGFVIPTGAIEIHGIDNEMAQKEGVDIEVVMKAFMKDLEGATVIVGHNIKFDRSVVGAELVRLHLNHFLLEEKVNLCTMLIGTDVCKIPTKWGYKWPKLQELHKMLFGGPFDNSHNAMADTMAAFRCFWKLVDYAFIDEDWLRKVANGVYEMKDERTRRAIPANLGIEKLNGCGKVLIGGIIILVVVLILKYLPYFFVFH